MVVDHDKLGPWVIVYSLQNGFQRLARVPETESDVDSNYQLETFEVHMAKSSFPKPIVAGLGGNENCSNVDAIILQVGPSLLGSEMTICIGMAKHKSLGRS